MMNHISTNRNRIVTFWLNIIILTIDNVVAMQEFNGKVVPCFTLGKYRGLGVEFVAGFDQGYIAWAIGDTSKFVPSTKEYLKKFLKV